MNNDIIFPLVLTFIAGLSTAIGSLIAISIKTFDKKYLQFSLGLSAGVMIYISFVELLNKSIQNIGFMHANIAFFVGIIFIMLIDMLVPHEYIAEKVTGQKKKNKVLTAGIFTALGVLIHNIPEGMAVFVSSIGDKQLAFSLAFAIAVHNIPEGFAIATPIYYVTKSKKKAFIYSALSGLAEPLGAVLCILVLMPFISEFILYLMLAFVGGIMVFISLDELLPLAYEDDKGHVFIIAVLIGMSIMAFSLWLF